MTGNRATKLLRQVQEYKPEALEYLREHGGPSTEMLSCAFSWADTPQGYHFWRDIADHIPNGWK